MDIQHLVLQLKDKGLTQAEIGKEAGCSQSTVSDIENGNIGQVRPSYQLVTNLQKLAERHGIELNQ
jgi:transcriptional regulator with XRE-family HTH domain